MKHFDIQDRTFIRYCAEYLACLGVGALAAVFVAWLIVRMA